MASPLDSSRRILAEAIDRFSPTHIVSMVSGGKDSASSDQVARELGAKIDLVMHGNTRCGIPETSQFVRENYGRIGDFDDLYLASQQHEENHVAQAQD